MKTPLRLLALIITLVCFSLSANAQDQPSATNIALAGQLVELMPLDQGMTASIDRMKQLQAKITNSTTNASPETKEMLQKTMDNSMNVAAAVLNCEKMKTMYVSVYASSYTAEELQGAINFYKTPIGQRWVEKQPQVAMTIASKSMGLMPQIMDSLNKSMGALDALRKGTNSILSNFLPPASPSSTPTN